MQCSLQHKLPMAMAKLLQSHTCHGSTCCYSRLSLNHSRNPNSTYSLLHCKAKGTGKSQKRRVVVLVASASAPEPEKTPQAQSAKAQPEKTTPTKPVKVLPKKEKPVYSMKKGQIVRVDKEKYLNSINYLSVGHPPYFKGLDYIYEDRGEILNLRHFETGEYALISWVGIPTAPAWLPTYMLIKSEKLNYERM